MAINEKLLFIRLKCAAYEWHRDIVLSKQKMLEIVYEESMKKVLKLTKECSSKMCKQFKSELFIYLKQFFAERGHKVSIISGWLMTSLSDFTLQAQRKIADHVAFLSNRLACVP